MMDFNKRHGGPYDRGGSDSWYGRGYNPHYYTGASMQTPRIDQKDMSVEEIAAYSAGYEDNESDPSMRKDWG